MSSSPLIVPCSASLSGGPKKFRVSVKTVTCPSKQTPLSSNCIPQHTDQESDTGELNEENAERRRYSLMALNSKAYSDRVWYSQRLRTKYLKKRTPKRPRGRPFLKQNTSVIPDVRRVGRQISEIDMKCHPDENPYWSRVEEQQVDLNREQDRSFLTHQCQGDLVYCAMLLAGLQHISLEPRPRRKCGRSPKSGSRGRRIKGLRGLREDKLLSDWTVQQMSRDLGAYRQYLQTGKKHVSHAASESRPGIRHQEATSTDWHYDDRFWTTSSLPQGTTNTEEPGSHLFLSPKNMVAMQNTMSDVPAPDSALDNVEIIIVDADIDDVGETLTMMERNGPSVAGDLNNNCIHAPIGYCDTITTPLLRTYSTGDLHRDSDNVHGNLNSGERSHAIHPASPDLNNLQDLLDFLDMKPLTPLRPEKPLSHKKRISQAVRRSRNTTGTSTPKSGGDSSSFMSEEDIRQTTAAVESLLAMQDDPPLM